MNHLYNTLKHFLDHRDQKEVPFLLGFSGGPDSLALFHLLLKYREEHGAPFAVAHIDHGWRPESKKEAEEIVALAGKHEVLSHVLTISPQAIEGNLEAGCRDARYKFFSFLCREHGYRAVMLGHHADDQAETVLKRLFEGAALEHLGGMYAVSELNGMTLWRPLLNISKKEILNWLSSQSLQGFEDRTNDDVRFLRARMRRELIPCLSESFGKEISPALCRLGEETRELKEYLDARVNPTLSLIVCGEMGIYLEDESLPEMSSLELKHLIKKFAAIGELSLSREALAKAANLVQTKAVGKSVAAGSQDRMKTLHIDHGHLFMPNRQLGVQSFNEFELLPGKIATDGYWEVLVTEENGEFPRGNCTDWKQLWEEGGEVVLPKGNYQIGAPDLTCLTSRGETLAKRLSSEKVPVPLRSAVPVVLKEGTVVHEFLSGKRLLTVNSNEIKGIKVSIRWLGKVSG